MTYLSARRFSIPLNALLDRIRGEIFTEKYSSIDFAATQGDVLICERHQPKSRILNCLNFALKKIWNPYLRTKDLARRGEEKAYKLIQLNNECTNSTGLISVDHFLTMICYYAKEGPTSKHLQRQQETSLEYLWMNGNGLQAQSIHGGHTWETALLIQSLVSACLIDAPNYTDVISRGYSFLTRQQHLQDWSDSPPAYRFSRIGGWPFTVRYHGYACSDCTGEALKAIMLTERLTELPRATRGWHIRLGVDNLLMNQNKTGGYSSFEPVRAGQFLEFLNGTESFGNVMVEHDYTECTSSAITALFMFQKQDSTYRANEVKSAIDRGMQFIRRSQRPNGSWQANWGICYTYSAMFALDALSLAGETYENSVTVRSACDFLVSHQKSDGGWGETIDVGPIQSKAVRRKPKIQTLKTNEYLVNFAWHIH